MLDPEEVLDRYLEELNFELTKAGRGVQARIQKALDLRSGYIHDMFRRRYVELGKGMAVVDAMGLDVLSFFERVLGSPAGAVDAFAREGARLGGTLLPIIERAAEQFHGHRPPQDLSPSRDSLPYAYRLRNIEELIERRPHEAVRQAEVHIESSLGIEADVDAAAPVARGLGCYATACCRIGRSRSAHQALSVGLDIATAYGLRAVVAELTRRGVEVLRCRNANAAALRLASSALRLYEDLGDGKGRAQVLIDQGLLLERAGRPNAAQASLTEALDLLPKGEDRKRFIASWALARIALREGAIADAERHAAAAGAVAAARSPTTGWLYRLQGAIAVRRKMPKEAEAHFEQARQIFEATAEPHGLALAAAELIRLQRQRRAISEAEETAKRFLPPLLTSFVRNRSATHALGELLRAAHEKRLTTVAIDRAVEAVEQTDPEIRWR